VASRLWLITAAVFAAAALLAWPVDRQLLLWHPDQPWRAFTAPLAHLSLQHLIANLAGCAAIGWLGHAARLPARASLAWWLAWPLTQLGLLLRPELQSYGGLSGVLHAGVAIVGVELLQRRGRERWIGVGLLLGLLLKLWIDDPLGPPGQFREGWNIPIAPFAHLSGAVVGAAIGALAALLLGTQPFQIRRNSDAP
jgi:rhomboid family GlyGly-CTERM serine protease